MTDITVRPGEKCPTCHIRMDELRVDGSSILYGQGIGQLIITEDGRKFVAKTMLEDVTHDIILVAAYVCSVPSLTADDATYQAARKLLETIADVPDSVRMR